MLKILPAVLIALLGFSPSANALDSGVRIIQISSDQGGSITDYMHQAVLYKNSKTRLRITGTCDSACTLYLTLPRNQLCVSPTAQFRFHAPIADNARAVSTAQRFLMAKYPKWVRDWIGGKGGLTPQLITMDYATSSKFLPVCATIVAAR
jgi:hypothetical protein